MRIVFKGIFVAFLAFAVLAPAFAPMMAGKAMAASAKKKEKKTKKTYTAEERKKIYEWAREQCDKNYHMRVARVHVDLVNMKYTCWIN